MKELGELNNTQIRKDEVQEAVKEMKAGKVSGLDGCAVQCLISRQGDNKCDGVVSKIIKVLSMISKFE